MIVRPPKYRVKFVEFYPKRLGHNSPGLEVRGELGGYNGITSIFEAIRLRG